MDICWGIHAGKTGDADSLFLVKESPCITIGWEAMGNLSNIENDREAINTKLVEAYSDTKKLLLTQWQECLLDLKMKCRLGIMSFILL
jgi:predicted Mrr-cat superfamily restriction endonuclease